ncbi:prohead core-like protein [Aeromonas phage phiAS5]|uniref:Prohead core-like protein n=1 Tax=Aeromonas phage phiAS5 TaxID=879630 RepID=E1A2B3_9CAUD|nr:head scaffolding protein [Aeromonas phage phiAS5]ADM79859.1 prohead core-like protein [Aeromonas phage phiAS5]BES53035.1 hypothetical protein [Aeromonas phage phiWae14]
MSKEIVLAKWKASAHNRIIESEEELEILKDLIAERKLIVGDRLEEMKTSLGDVVDTVLENMLNTDEAIDALAMLSLQEKEEDLQEVIVKRVDALGVVTRIKDRKTRERQATQTTGLSKAARRQIARKAAKTKRSHPNITRKAIRKRKKAMKKRDQMGL